MAVYWKWMAGGALIAATAAPASGWLDWTRAKDYQRREADEVSTRREASGIVADWPDGARVLAEDMLDEYGTPDQTLPFRLTWKDRAPWSLVEVYRDDSSRTQVDNLLEAVRYDAPVGRWRALSALDCGVTYDAVAGRLVARSDSEAINFLALNVADDVIRGRRTPEQGRAFYDTTMELFYSGKSSRYMRGLRFIKGVRP